MRSSCQLAIHNDYCQPFAHKRSSQEHSLDIWYISVFYRDTHKTAQRIHFVVCFTYQTLFKGSKGRFNFIYNIWRLSRVSNKQKYSSLRSHILRQEKIRCKFFRLLPLRIDVNLIKNLSTATALSSYYSQVIFGRIPASLMYKCTNEVTEHCTKLFCCIYSTDQGYIW